MTRCLDEGGGGTLVTRYLDEGGGHISDSIFG